MHPSAFSRLSLFLAVLLTSVSTASSASVKTRQAWNFDDPATTALTGVLNSVTTPATGIPGFGAFATDIPGVATDGAGSLSIQYNNPATSGISYVPFGTFAAASGIFTLTVTVSAWDLPSGTTNLQTVYFDLRNGATTATSLVAELTFLASDAGVSVRFRDSAAANNNTFLTGLPVTRSTPFVLVLTVNKNTGTFSISYTDAGATTQVVTDKALSAGSAGRAITHFDLRTLGNFTGGGFTIDSVVFASVLTPIQSWREVHFTNTEPEGQAADTADPDGDGIPNLLEYAGGTLPLLANSSAPGALGLSPESLLTLAYASIADFDLSYTVETSSDLATWAPLSSARGSTLVPGPQLFTDTVPVGSVPRRFLRLSVSR